MNIATDLIEREHEEIERCIEACEATMHRSRAFDLCSAVEEHTTMEDEVLHPVLADLDQDVATTNRADHAAQDELVDRVRHASDRRELRQVVAELADAVRRHVATEEADVLPAMEDHFGVASMNELGIELLDWQHRRARQERDNAERCEELLELTREELYERAQQVDLDGRSRMKKAELAEALSEI